MIETDDQTAEEIRVMSNVKSLIAAKGVTFEHYDNLPGLTRKDDVHSAGDIRVVWLKDPDGNILSIQNRLPKPGQS